jgi:hypothetical protein
MMHVEDIVSEKIDIPVGKIQTGMLLQGAGRILQFGNYQFRIQPLVFANQGKWKTTRAAKLDAVFTENGGRTVILFYQVGHKSITVNSHRRYKHKLLRFERQDTGHDDDEG